MARVNQTEQGIALITVAVSLAVLVPILGLSVDGGLLWAANNKLDGACHAAALATARSLGAGLTLPDQIAYATARGEAFFKANFDSSQFGSEEVTPVISVAEIAPTILEVRASATVNVSAYFIRYLGPNATTVQASSRVVRRDVNLMIALDTSHGKYCEETVRQAKLFADSFMADRDRVGLTINGQAVAEPTSRFKGALKAKVDGIRCAGSSAAPMDAAYQAILKLNRPEALNAVVWITHLSTPSSIAPVTTYVIHRATLAPERTLFRRFANDPREPNHDPARPAGMFLEVGELSQLAEAFSTITNDLVSSGR